MSSDFEDQVPREPIASADALSADSSEVYGLLSVISGSGVTLWSSTDTDSLRDTLTKPNLRLAPDCPAVIGRAEGHRVPYLDPSYRPTRVVPGSGQNIMSSGGADLNGYVSRGHFMLRMAGRGILLINGVPRVGGGIRAPRNGTRMVSPESRPMIPGEEYLIESGAAIVIVLPNNAEVRISVE